MRTTALLSASVVLLLGVGTSPVEAQGVLPLDGDFSYVIVEGRFGSCGDPANYEFSGGLGELTFAPDGTLTGTAVRRDVCQDGTVSEGVELLAGTHLNDDQGHLYLDLDPSQPGTETTTLALRFDHRLVLIGNPDDMFPSLGLALPKATAATDASLSGAYAYVRLLFEQLPGGLSASSEAGLLTFDGAGSYGASGLQHIVTPTTSINLLRTDAGSYAVDPDGVFVAGAAGHVGMLSPDGELVAWLERSGTRIGLVVALRRGGGYQPADLFGPSTLAGSSLEPGTGADAPRFQAVTGVVTLDGLAGSFDFTGQELAVSPAGTTTASASDSGSLAVQSNGVLQVQGAGSPAPLVGAVGADRATAILAEVADPSRVQVLLLPRRLVPAQPYGSATAGSAALAPALSASGGLPFLGNTSFALQIDQALGGAPVVAVVSLAPLLGVPTLGASLWIDPAQQLALLSAVATGPGGVPGAGSATLAAPLPGDPLLGGLDLYAQAIVVDPGGPSGFAWSAGLALQPW